MYDSFIRGFPTIFVALNPSLLATKCMPVIAAAVGLTEQLGKGSKFKLIIFAEFSANGGWGTPHP